jgi:NADPH:quinone reductase-like Zn-dependent oxidoreductase
MALTFANAWGCEVTAFTSTDVKAAEARSFGAHHVVNTRNDDDLKRIAGTLDLLLVTVNVPLNWPAMMGTLRPKGRLHVVGAVLEPIPLAAFPIIMGLAERRACDLSAHARVLCAPQDRAHDRTLSDRQGQRRDPAPARRQGAISHRARRRGVTSAGIGPTSPKSKRSAKSTKARAEE